LRRLEGMLGVGATAPKSRFAGMVPVLIGFVTLLLIFALGPSDLDDALAQSPSPTSGFSIQFINPGEPVQVGTTPGIGPGSEVSDKPENMPAGQTGDSLYHLVAWVNQVPASASVEFKVQSKAGGSVEQNLGAGTQVGGASGDTFEIFWNPPDSTDQDFFVRAVLFSSGSEVARDEETVTVNTANSSGPTDPNNEPQSETVEINYPLNGGALGFFTPTGTTVPATVVDVKFSGGATIKAYYTVSLPGTEPAWKECGSESVSAAADGVRCTLKDGDQPTAVRAVGARVDDADVLTTPTVSEVPDSGDAHRAFGYVQFPSSMTAAPDIQGKVAGSCSDVIITTVLDSQGRKIAGVNVDVHAKGPTDQLLFDDTGGNSDTHKNPDKAHAFTENTRDCEGSGQSGQQGEHEVGAPDIDTKHIESTAGTSDAGTFKFQLFSPDAGTTQATAFADTDDDDLFCSEEKSANASVNWSAASPPPGGSSPTGLPSETTNCPQPTPTPSPTTTGSPTSTASPTTSPAPTARTVTLSADDNKVKSGKTVKLFGQVVSSDSSCEDDEFVRIRKRKHGTTRFKELDTAQTDPDGSFQKNIKVKASADYVAFAPAHDNCAEASSDPDQVLAKVKVSADANDHRVPTGDNVRITGAVNPDHDGTKVILQRKKGRKFVKVDSDKLNRRSQVEFVLTVDWNGKRVFRVKWNSKDKDHESGHSDNVTVRGT
jgi:hypothetical protein